MVDADHAPTTMVTMEAYTSSLPGPPISAPISELIPVSKQFNSTTSVQGIETPHTVSDHPVLILSLLITGYLAHVFGFP